MYKLKELKTKKRVVRLCFYYIKKNVLSVKFDIMSVKFDIMSVKFDIMSVKFDYKN